MESDHRPAPLLLLSLMLLLTARCSHAQPPSSNNNNNNNNSGYLSTANFNPSMAIVIVVLISAFFFLGFFSIYIRQCAGDRLDPRSIRGAAAAAARSRRQRGLDPSVLETFPTLVYSQVKDLKIGKNALECAVCLCEFEDDETLRLLPKCDHVFHPDCIDAWLASHVTCPVCRSNLVPDPNAPDPELPAADPASDPEIAAAGSDPPADQVAIEVRDDESDLKSPPPMIDFSRISNMRRARSRARPPRFPRSHSTGHSVVQPGENLDRFTLRLPENVRREIVAAKLLQRTSSCVAFPSNGEGSSRRGNSRWFGEGSTGRAGRSIRLGRSDRWGSVLLRTLSARVPGWAGGRRGDLDGSVKKGEGSTNGGKLAAFVTPFDCLSVAGGGGGGGNEKGSGKGDEDESSSSGLARVRPS